MGEEGKKAFTLDPDTFKKIQPLEYHRRFINEGVRADGRALMQFRPSSINSGIITTAQGSCIVKMGNTSVVCAIKAEIAPPLPLQPSQGFLVPNIDLPSLCSPQFSRSGLPSELTQTLSRLLDSIVSNGRLLDLESLCIVSGQYVWTLFADIVCLDHSGNVFDACVTALMGALSDVRLPGVTVTDTDTGSSTLALNDDAPVTPLQLTRFVCSKTFGIFDGDSLIADPTFEEEEIISNTVTVVMDGHGAICCLYIPGGASVTKPIIDKCITMTRKSLSN